MMDKNDVNVKSTNKSKISSALTLDDIAEFKKRYDSGLVDAIFTRIEDIDFSSAFNVALNQLLDQSPGGGAFDQVAITRRKFEASLIEQEARMFEQMANLMTQMNTRYARLTGVPVVGAIKEETNNG